MTSSFRLSRRKELPASVSADGQRWAINTGTRAMLRIIRMLSDEDLAPWHRSSLLIEWFYVDGHPSEPFAPFTRFLRAGEDETEADADAAPMFDYEFDAAEIYASFMHLYGIDLFSPADDLHWWRFRALLGGCFAMECPLSAKIRLRRMDPNKADVQTQRAIELAQIPTRESEAERRLSTLINERLQNGLPFDDLLQAGREVT